MEWMEMDARAIHSTAWTKWTVDVEWIATLQVENLVATPPTFTRWCCDPKHEGQHHRRNAERLREKDKGTARLHSPGLIGHLSSILLTETMKMTPVLMT
jgi:hypothetical protein